MRRPAPFVVWLVAWTIATATPAIAQSTYTDPTAPDSAAPDTAVPRSAPPDLRPVRTVTAEIEPPRGFGYRIGDTLQVRVSVVLPRGYALEGRSLSGDGLPAWLELRERSEEVHAAGEDRRHELRFVFQIFHAPDSVTRLALPERRLVFRAPDTGEPVEAVVPEIGITVAPLTDRASVPAPDFAVPRPSRARLLTAGAALGGTLLLAGLGLVVARRRRRTLRFRAAHQRIVRARDCAEAALELHRALEARARAAIFAGDLDPLIERWPAAEPLRPDLDDFFLLSERLFYEDGGRRAGPDCLDRIRDLSRRLMEAEKET